MTENIQDNIDYQNGLQVLREEIAGLEAMAAALDDQFIAAVDAIDDMRSRRTGRLIIGGIGKSGHVGRKMAATMASTGTPSYYVHPGEASHGDLGMVTENDVVLMLSNSGENPELSDLIHYTRRFGI
ncbi:MAG: SIS domain-containing protein, partial [Pseudomonadota bacterium]|nr:SIS domain-containing protein [Pseudomonadota bacterium]